MGWGSQATTVGVVLCSIACIATSARAEGAASLGDPMYGTGGLVLGGDRGGNARNDAAERSDDPMASAGIGIKLGLGFTPSMTVDSPLSKEFGTRLGARTGLLLAVPISLGDGSGIGFDLEPFLLRYKRRVQVEGFDNAVTEFGGYFGPVYRFHKQHFYFSVGIGPKFGWINDDLFDVGVDLFGRIPLTATYYVSDGVGVTFELGLAYGVTGVKTRAIDDDLVVGLAGSGASAGALGGASEAVSVQFGSGFAMDSSIGVRFP